MDRYLYDATVLVRYSEAYGEQIGRWRLLPSIDIAKEAIEAFLEAYGHMYEGYDGEAPKWFECFIDDSPDKYGGYPDRDTCLKYYYVKGQFVETEEEAKRISSQRKRA